MRMKINIAEKDEIIGGKRENFNKTNNTYSETLDGFGRHNLCLMTGNSILSSLIQEQPTCRINSRTESAVTDMPSLVGDGGRPFKPTEFHSIPQPSNLGYCSPN
ncbi:hypothetical protein FPOAC2_07743 [Fusarium poae]